MPLDYFTDREIFEAVTLSIWLRGGKYEAIYEEKSGRSKVTASEKGGFASKTAFLLRWRSASVTGLNVTGSSGDEIVKKPNGIRYR